MKSPLVTDREHDDLCFVPLGSLTSIPPPETIPEVSVCDSDRYVFSEFIFNATVEDVSSYQ